MNKKIMIGCFFLWMVLCSFQPLPLTIYFKFYFSDAVLNLQNNYTTGLGEQVTINRFQFYISAIKAIDEKGDTTPLSNAHYLIDISDSLSHTIQVKSTQKIKRLVFTLGVDSLLNISGIQTGSLDPAKGMFWTWRSGYIMAKLHGVSPQANTAGKRFSFEVGGFQDPFNAVRVASLEIVPTKKTIQEIIIHTDLSKWFGAIDPITIAQTPNCHQPSKLAMQLANNYAQSFTIASIQ